MKEILTVLAGFLTLLAAFLVCDLFDYWVFGGRSLIVEWIEELRENWNRD